MACVEVWKNEKLIARREVDEQRAIKGCRVRLGTKGQIQLCLGESKRVGSYRVYLVANQTGSPSTEVQQDPEGIVRTKRLSRLKFSSAGRKGQTPTLQSVPKIEGYHILDHIGSGGMGTVWRAIQLSTKREVALKLIGPSIANSDKSITRFEREVALAAKLTHPNIARIYESGLNSGIYYYAMELIKGEPLDEYINHSKLDQRQILELTKRICKAMVFAHGVGVVHRDLKPSNIIVSEDGEPHILDFGLAKALDKDLGELTISVEGEIAGTPGYMAPEQAAGRIKTANELWDVYSLGVILYQLLIHNMPHDMSGSPYDVFRRKVEQDVIPPRKVEPSINSDLECLLLKALARQPRDRYASIKDFATDIDNYLAGKPLSAKKGNTFYFIYKNILSLRKHVAVLGVAALALFCLWYILMYVNSTLDPNNNIVESRVEKSSQELLYKQRIQRRINYYRHNLEAAFRNNDWRTATEELNRIKGALSLKSKFFNETDIMLEEELDRWERLIRQGSQNSPIGTASTPTNPRRLPGYKNESRFPYYNTFQPQVDTPLQDTNRRSSRSGVSSPTMRRRQTRSNPTKRVVNVETPLGIIKDYKILYGENMRLGKRRVKTGHCFVTLTIEARKAYQLVSISNWILINSKGNMYPILGIMTDDGKTVFGVGSMSINGSRMSPKETTFVFEVSEVSKYVDFYIGNRSLGTITFPENR